MPRPTLYSPSGTGHGDLDHLPHLAEARVRICADPHTIYCFVSPGGDGLKVGVRIPLVADDDTYKRYWQAIADYYQQRYGLPWDPSGKDVCRLCYLSWDPKLYYNPAAQPFPVPPVPTAPPCSPGQYVPHRVIPRDQRTRYAQQALDTAVKMIDASAPGNRPHQARTKASDIAG